MIITEKNEGKKINYVVVQSSKILFDDMLSVNVARYQKDQENVVDICLDEDMQLTTGLGKWYVANVIIPPRKYGLVDSGEKDENGNPKYERVAEPLNMDEVTLILWALPVNYIAGGAF